MVPKISSSSRPRTQYGAPYGAWHDPRENVAGFCPFSSCPLFVHYSCLLSSWVKEFSYGTRTPAAEPAAGGESQVLCTNHKLRQCLNANPSSVSPTNSYHHLTWKGMLLVYLRVHMRGQTAQMSLLTLHHLSVTSPIQFTSNQTAEAAQAAREAARQGRLTRSCPGIMALLKNTRKRKCSKRTEQEGGRLGWTNSSKRVE